MDQSKLWIFLAGLIILETVFLGCSQRLPTPTPAIEAAITFTAPFESTPEATSTAYSGYIPEATKIPTATPTPKPEYEPTPQSGLSVVGYGMQVEPGIDYPGAPRLLKEKVGDV